MCYDVKATLETQLKRARRRGDESAVDEILERLVPYTDLPIYHASGFSHPELLIYTNESPDYPCVATWGLVPQWVEEDKAAKEIWNKTLNARGETIFKKPSFKDASRQSRCLIYIDGFYEHHHFGNKTYPFFIYRKDGNPIVLAGLWTEWNHDGGGFENTFSIVTTEGNLMMAEIHNNPKLKSARMPLILNTEDEEIWLNDDAPNNLENLIRPFPEDKLTAHTVAKLRGKDYSGNVETISDKVDYPELPLLLGNK